MNHKNILPTEARIDYNLKDNIETVTSILDKYYETHGSYTPTSDADIEGIEKMSEYSTTLSRLLSEEHTDASEFVSNQACLLAYFTSGFFTPEDTVPTVSSHAYFDTLADVEEVLFAETVRQDVDEYLKENPTIELLLDVYKSQLDPAGRYQELARTVGGLIFLQIELGAEKRYIEDVLAGYAKQL